MNSLATSPTPQPASGHHVQFYDSETPLINAVADHFASALRAGRPVVGIVTSAHRELLLRRLEAFGLTPPALLAPGLLTLLDARETLTKLMSDGAPDAQAFTTLIGTLVEDRLALVPGASVCAYGEMVDLLCQSGEHAAAVALEALWNRLVAQVPLTLLCSYDLRGFPTASHRHAFDEICAQHDVVLPANTHARESERPHNLVEVARLQQQARALESEIVYRRRLEEGLREALERREAAEAEVRNREQELRDFFEAAAEPMHAVGADGRIEWANAAELQMLGYAADEYVGRHFAEFYVDRDAANDVFGRLGSNETLRNHETQLRHKDGSVRDVLVTSNVFRRDGRFIHTRCFTRDITQRKRVERALAEAVRVRDDFIAIASHELRNPIHAIHLQLLAAIELAKTGSAGGEPELGRLLGRASIQVTRLGRLLDNLLDVGRITAGRLEIEYQDCDLVVLVRSVVDRHRGESSCLTLETTAETIGGSWDPLRVDQVVTNLVINAIRYGKGLPVGVWIDADDNRVTVRVTDRGDGISPADQARIFERFERALTEHKPGGLGLGLWITRQIVDAMHGSVAVTSAGRPGSGSVFEVTLPRRSAPIAPAGVVHPRASS